MGQQQHSIEWRFAFDPYITPHATINLGWIRIKHKTPSWLHKTKREQHDIFIPAGEEGMIHYSGRERGLSELKETYSNIHRTKLLNNMIWSNKNQTSPTWRFVGFCKYLIWVSFIYMYIYSKWLLICSKTMDTCKLTFWVLAHKRPLPQ